MEKELNSQALGKFEALLLSQRIAFIFRFIEYKSGYQVSTLAFIIVLSGFTPIQIILSPVSISDSYLLIIIRAFIWIVQIYFTIKLYKTDPGICSHSLPIINERQMNQMSNFCNKCKCNEGQSIKHCINCDVCIKGSFIHSKMLGRCITQANLIQFCLLWISAVINSLICLYH